ncbi:MAG: nucleotidyltransferase domain-containing protein [bacterium]|nr:nucleotidyltransferase domain-containing protein [bacterium]
MKKREIKSAQKSKLSKLDSLISALSVFFEEKARGYNIDMAFLYGSWARGHPIKESDVDLAVLFFPELTSDYEVFEIITDISFELSIKINREVNTIPLYEDFRRPMLYYNAIVLGIPLYFREFERYVVLKNQAIAQMEDFNLFGTRWQLEIARKNLEVLQHV